jgi:triacylglycerol lipase
VRADIAKFLRELPGELGPNLTGPTKAFFAPMHERPYADLTLTSDIRYGENERHRLDVFTTGGTGKPVLVFVHGGGFVGGDKADPSGPYPYYENLGVWAARRGFVGVTITYRRAPEFTYPSGAQDVGLALKWVLANIAQHGGDPAKIVLMGQSAGASHVASYAGLAQCHAAPGGGVVAIVVMSGVYDFAGYQDPVSVSAYCGATPLAAASPIGGVAAWPKPLMFSVSEFDPPEFHRQTKALFDLRYAHEGRIPNFCYIPGHNHISQVAHLGAKGTEDPLFGDRLANFIETVTGS